MTFNSMITKFVTCLVHFRSFHAFDPFYIIYKVTDVTSGAGTVALPGYPSLSPGFSQVRVVQCLVSM